MGLFLGFPVDSACSEALERADSKLLEAFIREDYLLDVTHSGGRFLGKQVGEEVSLSDLELIEKNIMSLLNKIIPNFQISSDSLVLFPIV